MRKHDSLSNGGVECVSIPGNLKRLTQEWKDSAWEYAKIKDNLLRWKEQKNSSRNRRQEMGEIRQKYEGFMYHCVIRDIVTGDVLGDHMPDWMTKEHVLNAIKAMQARHELANLAQDCFQKYHCNGLLNIALCAQNKLI